MSVEWPASLPMPQFGLRYGLADPQMRTLMASGRTISRRRFSYVPTEFSARWMLTTAEAAAFEQFYQGDAVDGTEWIEMPLVTAHGAGSQFVRFIGAYRYGRVGPGLWEYSANMQIGIPSDGDGGVGVEVGGSLVFAQLPYGLNSGVIKSSRVTRLANDGAGTWIATTEDARASISFDSGVNWTTLIYRLNSSTSASAIYSISSDKNGVWFAGLNAGYTSRSSDGGITWAEHTRGLNSGSTTQNVNSISNDEGSVWVAVMASGYCARSTNNAVTWSSLTRGLNSGSTSAAWADVKTNTATGVWVAVAASGYCSRSTDNGATWTSITRGLNSGSTTVNFAALATNGTVWIAGGSSGYASRSTDDGVTWSALTQFSSAVLSIANNASTFLLTTATDTHISTDNGATWAPLDLSPLVGENIASISYGDGVWVYCGGSDGVGNFENGRSPNTFTITPIPIFTQLPRYAGHPSSISEGYRCATDGSGVWIVGLENLSRSSDNDATWNDLPDGLNSGITSTSSKLSTDKQGNWIASFLLGYSAKSTDNGETWSASTRGFNDGGPSITAERIVHAISTGVFITTSDTGQCARTTNSGSTWSSLPAKLNSGNPGAASQFAVRSKLNSSVIFSINASGYFSRSTDDGASWTAITRYLGFTSAEFSSISDIGINRTTGKCIAVNTSAYAAESTDDGATWTDIPGLTGYSAGFSLIICDDDELWVVSCADQTYFVSDDDGATWTHRNGIGLTAFARFIYDGVIYCTSSSGPIISYDLGNTWILLLDYAIAVGAASSENISALGYDIGDDGKIIYGMSGSYLFKSEPA